jgi:protease I
MSLTGKTVVILVEDIYQDQEVWYPYFRLIEEGAKVLVAGTGKKKVYKSKHGYEIKATTDAAKIKASDVDGIFVPGGYAPDFLRRYDFVNKLVADVFKQGKLVASICHGQWVLCSADILKGKKATCFFAIKADVINAGANYVDQEVVVDGNLVTSRCPEDLPAFMREALKILRS